MMRSLYSAVSGLKTHQTRMDVIGNNIANVNTEAFKASRVTFKEIMYQTVGQASAGNAAQNRGGVNAKQIGLGVSSGAISVSVTTAGASETTGNPFDLKLTDSQSTNFFIVSDGVNNFFTRSGSYYVDGNGFLCMTSTGYTLMGWQVDPTTGEIKKDTVSALQVMSAKNQTSAPEATTKGNVSGILDKNDPNLKSSVDGYVMTLNFFDDLGYSYTARFSVKPKGTGEGEDAGKYNVSLTDILDSKAKSIIYDEVTGELIDPAITTDSLFSTGEYAAIKDADGNVQNYLNADGKELKTIASADRTKYYYYEDADKNIVITTDDKNKDGAPYTPLSENMFDATGNLYYYEDKNQNGDNVMYLSERAYAQHELVFDSNEGNFVSISNGDAVTLRMSQIMSNYTDPVTGRTSEFQDISIDFSSCLNLNNGGTSTMGALKGVNGEGTGKQIGALTGITVDSSGKIFGTYDNGNTQLLGQISVAQFTNAMGLEKIGDNCYQTSLISGQFDGIGLEITADGSSISTGELEMSNVDLSAQFTDMIVTQRGFQANSRVITTSDSLLEELINLKR